MVMEVMMVMMAVVIIDGSYDHGDNNSGNSDNIL